MENNNTPAPETEESKDKNLNEFEIDELIKSTYNKIAVWHNGNPDNLSLKHLTLELIEDIAGEVFNHFGLTYDSGLKMDKEAKSKIDEFKKENNIEETKAVDSMSDTELMAELNKRRLKRS